MAVASSGAVEDQNRKLVQWVRERVRKLRNETRRAEQALAELEHVWGGGDRFGEYVVAPGEKLDEEEVLDYLRLARSEHESQELHVIVIAL